MDFKKLLLTKTIITKKKIPKSQICTLIIDDENIGPVWTKDILKFLDLKSEFVQRGFFRIYGSEELIPLVHLYNQENNDTKQIEINNLEESELNTQPSLEQSCVKPKQLPDSSPEEDVFEQSYDLAKQTVYEYIENEDSESTLAGLAFIGHLTRGSKVKDSVIKKSSTNFSPDDSFESNNKQDKNKKSIWVYTSAISAVVLLCVFSYSYYLDATNSSMTKNTKMTKTNKAKSKNKIKKSSKSVKNDNVIANRKEPLERKEKNRKGRSPASVGRVTHKKTKSFTEPRRKKKNSFKHSTTYKKKMKKRSLQEENDYYYEEADDLYPVEQDEVRERLSKETIDPEDVYPLDDEYDPESNKVDEYSQNDESY